MPINFSFQETWLHRINPSVKFFLLVVMFMLVLFIHNLNFLINLTVAPLLLIVLATGHPLKRVLLFSSPLLLIFISTSSAMIFFGKGETTWLHWGLVHITEESFFRGIHLGFRALNFGLLGLIFALTTRPVLFFYSLMQQVKIAPKYAYSFMAALRLMPIMLEEFQVLRYALKVRGVQEERGWKGFYQKVKYFSIPLLAQSIRRAQRIAVAMEAKRFSQFKQRTFYYQLGFSKFDVLFVGYFMILIWMAFMTSQVFPYFDIVDVRHVG